MDSNKKVILVSVILVAAIGITIAALKPNNRLPSQELVMEKATTKNIQNTKMPFSKHSVPMPDQTEEIWKNWFENQAGQLGQLNDDPNLIQTQLQETADAIPKNRIPWLLQIAKNEKINTDQRLLAVEYLSRSANIEKLDALEDIVLTPINNDLPPALKNEATVLKAAAIEGLSMHPEGTPPAALNRSIAKLNNIIDHIDDNFLLDRAHRSLWYLKGSAPKPEEQDTKALNALIGKS